MVNPEKFRDLPSQPPARTQSRQAIANIVVARLLPFAAVYAFTNNYVAAGPLTLAISVGAVRDADVVSIQSEPHRSHN